ncbi:nucleotidyltransferase, partial [bacterium]|nr:nucleotidyltransferase [bacterium]
MYNNESAKAQLTWILDRIGFRLEITETQRKLAEERYNAVGKWLAAEGSSLAEFKPVIYPQGSLRIGTTTKPIKHEEYDLDLVCELQIDWNSIHPLNLLKMVFERIRSNKLYESIVERKKRCVRLNYADDFHLDILSACLDLKTCGTCVKVPDRKMNGGNGGWSASNPKGNANWFEKIAEQYEKLLLEKRIEPLPKPEPSVQKPPLKRAVQLLKRWRDIEFQNLDEFAPVSIVLTTLAGHLYHNDSFLLDAFTNIVDGIVELIERTEKPIIVYNPTNAKEILSEKWHEKPEAYKLFKQKITALKL